MTLDVLISTIDRGIHSAARVPIEPIDGVRWIVSWQMTGDESPELPPELRRPDVLVDTTRERGLSRNRNNALRLATADICLIADDDVTYTREGLLAVIDAFERHPRCSSPRSSSPRRRATRPRPTPPCRSTWRGRRAATTCRR